MRRLVLIGAPTDIGASGSPAQRLDHLNATAAFLAKDDFEGLMRYHMGRVFSEPDVADLAASRLQRWLGMPRETVLSFFDPDPDMDIRPLLAAIWVPTLIAHGTEDRQVPFAAAEYLAAHIPGRSSIPSWATATSRCSPRPRSSATCCAVRPHGDRLTTVRKMGVPCA